MMRSNPDADAFYFDQTIKIRCGKKRLHDQDGEDNNESDRRDPHIIDCEEKRSKQRDEGV
jgi:hypothetical protein